MRYVLVLAALLLLGAPAPRAQAPAQKPLDIYFIDVEGGQATLLVSPSGESMLIDTGYPGYDGRDVARIEAAAKQAGVSRIDYLVVTHYHTDHAGNAPALVPRIPIRTFVDHGPNVEPGSAQLYDAYVGARKSGRHLQVAPGDTIPIAGLAVTVVAAGGRAIGKPLTGGGAANPFCAAHKPKEPDPSENAQSVGLVIGHGRFRMLDLGDLTWNNEHALVCPSNRIGPIDLYLTTHHGLDSSGPAALVHAVKPRVAIMNNGPKKGGSPSAWRIVRDAPGLEDFWQLHVAVDAGREFNTAADLIANTDETTAHAIKVSAQQDGSFTVVNTRNGVTKTYKARQ
jgi:beta-lactamase superfamily II metal-dependent hydrolase